MWRYVIPVLFLNVVSSGILYPRASETREVYSLDGIWKFKRSPTHQSNLGFEEKWFCNDLTNAIAMPVPSSYNDITSDPQLRDHVGWVWYQKKFFAPAGWKQNRLFIRFGSVHYTAKVYLNGKSVGQHSGGHLPFKFEITQHVNLKEENLLTVAVNNTLTKLTIPQGFTLRPNDTERYPPGYVIHNHAFDYFNYAGIHRPVYLYTVPGTHIEDVSTVTTVEQKTGIIEYTVVASQTEIDITEIWCQVSVLDHNEVVVATGKGLSGKLRINNVKLWWPRHSHKETAYLYTLQIDLSTASTEDVYRLPVGIRTLRWNATGLLLNGKPAYLRGFGRHEDLDIVGRGLDIPALVRDFNLMAWLGANAFRTSHYPYSEELMDLADSQGFMVILESPACTLKSFGPKLLKTHKTVITEMIERDKNRPSVIMWSLANEPLSNNPKAGEYFSALVNLTQELDPSRPVTFVTSQQPHTDKAVQFVDVICLNRYASWYGDGGRLDLIQYQMTTELKEWNRVFNKTVLVTEYGAGAMPGLHTLPSILWSEEYQIDLLQENFKVFDVLRIPSTSSPHTEYNETNTFLVGEMIWNFADFATEQEIIRPGLCMKGLFTRRREPKMAAHVVRKRFWHLATETSKTGKTMCSAYPWQS